MDKTNLPVAALLLCVFASVSEAVTDIRYERWEIFHTNLARDTVAPVDTASGVDFTFNATITAADLVHGLRFALAEKDATTRDVLMRFTLACNELPPVGADVLITTMVGLYCDASGKLRARNNSVNWRATWCDVPVQGLCGGNAPPALPSFSDPEDFELILLDENDQDGSFPTPEDGLSRSDGVSSGPVLAVEAPEFAASGSIGVYADSAGTLCSAQIKPNIPFRWYVVAHLEGMTRCGISVLSMGILGVPPDLFFAITPNPAAHAQINNPVSGGGLGFPVCERGDGETILLYTFDGIATSALHDVELVVNAGDRPSRFWPYPWINLCPAPWSNKQRMRGTTFTVNPPPGHPCGTTNASAATWGAVKSLYRDSH